MHSGLICEEFDWSGASWPHALGRVRSDFCYNGCWIKEIDSHRVLSRLDHHCLGFGDRMVNDATPISGIAAKCDAMEDYTHVTRD